MWEIRHNERFYRELSRIPLPTRRQIEEAAFGEEIIEDPFRLKNLEKLKGYRAYYKIRFGDYRVGLKIDKQSRTVEFRRVLHRKDIYRRFP